MLEINVSVMACISHAVSFVMVSISHARGHSEHQSCCHVMASIICSGGHGKHHIRWGYGKHQLG